MSEKINTYYKYTLFGILGLGIILRLGLLLKNPSFFYDEASLALNLINRSYSELFLGLDYEQSAPPIFLVLSKFFLSITDNSNSYLRDIFLRILPFIAGIAVLPAFYYFISDLTKNRFVQVISLFLITFNPLTINYCAQFKQYSLELLFGIMILHCFYKIIFKNKFKNYSIILISLAPWFSFSSFFIIVSSLIILLKKNRNIFLKVICPYIISCGLLYYTSLKNVFSTTYSDLAGSWAGSYSYLELQHPLRVLIRLGELFTYYKPASIILGGMVTAAIIVFWVTEKNLLKKVFLFLPILLTAGASVLRIYPVSARLILFLLPIIIIFISVYCCRYSKLIPLIFCVISFIFSFLYLPAPTATSHREALDYLESNLTPSDKILIDSDFNTYTYYAANKVLNADLVQIPYVCSVSKWQEPCKEFISNLPPGSYYLILPSAGIDSIIVNGKIIDKGNFSRSTVIKFQK